MATKPRRLSPPSFVVAADQNVDTLPEQEAPAPAPTELPVVEATVPANAPIASPSIETVESAIDEAARLVARLNTVRESAHRQTLDQINGLIGKLATLGYNYKLANTDEEPEPAPTRARVSGGTRKPVTGESSNFKADRECQYCKMIGHDGRLHRGQSTKKKFTNAELAALGVVIPANY